MGEPKDNIRFHVTDKNGENKVLEYSDQGPGICAGNTKLIDLLHGTEYQAKSNPNEACEPVRILVQNVTSLNDETTATGENPSSSNVVQDFREGRAGTQRR